MKNIKLQQKLAEKLNAKPIGHYFSCLCPFHTDTRPSLLIYPDYFICKSCNKQGSLEYLENNISLIPSHLFESHKHRILPRWTSWEQRYGSIEGIAKAAHENVLKGNDVYFKKRKVDQFIEQGYFGLLDGWIVIPVFDMNHQIVDIVTRALRQEGVKYVLRISDNNEPRPLYSPDWDKVLNSSTIYVPFGIFDVWAFEAIGLPALTGITGKSINAEQFSAFPTKSFIVVPDDGEEKDAYHLANSLGWRGSVLRLNYENDVKDPDGYRRIDPQQWKQLFEGDFHATNYATHAL